jgi:prepilin-type N-terminal cleavage/methylation domain-containing protein
MRTTQKTTNRKSKTGAVESVQGFTILEVLIAMIILSIGILSFYTVQSNSIKGNLKANAVSGVSTATQQKIEELLATSYADALFTEGDHTESGLAHPLNSITYTVTEWRTDGLDNDGDSRVDEFDERGIKGIVLTVNFVDKGTVKSSTVEFIKTEIL